MSELCQYLEIAIEKGLEKLIISNPFSKSEEYKKIIIENNDKCWIHGNYSVNVKIE